MNQKGNVASALGSILLGILLIVMKGKIITAAITLLAVFVIVGAIMDFVAGLVNYGIMKSVAGISASFVDIRRQDFDAKRFTRLDITAHLLRIFTDRRDQRCHVFNRIIDL